MSQAYNLGKFANTLNSSGQIDPTTGLVNQFPTTNLPTIPINKGGTNLTTVGSNGTILQTDGSAYTYGSASGAITWDTVKTSSFTAVAGYGYLVNTTSSTITVTLPASPSIGQSVTIVDYAGTAATNNINVSPNGSLINKGTGNIIISTNREGLTLVYIDSTQGWLSQSNVYSGNPPFAQQYSISYLIIAGGGGGGYSAGGGGGAGGLLTGSLSLTSGVIYTATVGGGGGGGSSNVRGVSGSNSLFSGSGITTQTAIGGGGGGSRSGALGASGGSGGGNPDGSTTAGGSGTSGQGNAGGAGGSSNGGGGGGGAGASGNAGSPAGNSNGGNGLSSSITGSAITYAGGGGGMGGPGYSSSGGSGGGGNGGSSGTSGTTNLGGGGGACYLGSAGSGGSGVVILSIPTAQYTGTTTGSPTVTTSGSNTILKYTSSGTYTA